MWKYQWLYNWLNFITPLFSLGCQDSVVGIATHYRLDGRGFEPSSAHLFRLALGLTHHPLQLVHGSFLRIEQMQHGIYHPPYLALRLRMSWVIHLLHPLCLHWHIKRQPLPLPLHNLNSTEYVHWYKSASTGVTCVTVYFLNKWITKVMFQFHRKAVSEPEISCSIFTKITKITSAFSLLGT